MADTIVAEATTLDVVEIVAPVNGPRRPIIALGVPVGAALVWIGLAVITDTTAVVRVALTIAGCIIVLVGLAAVVDRLASRRVDISLGYAVAWMTLVIVAAIAADWLPLAESLEPSKTFSTIPRLPPDLFSQHPLGTDKQALDELGGVIHGARISLRVGIVAVVIGTVVGGFIGMIAGYFRGATDGVIGLLTDALLAFPALILLLAVVSALDPTVLNISLVLAFLSVPAYVRLARANTLTYAQREFVLAARSLGASQWRIIVRELAPNVIRPLLAYSSIIIAVLIVAEASLSYLGVGIQPPTPTWGNMIAAGQTELETTPHLIFVPGTVMFLTVLALNRIGDWARAKWDPRQSKL